MALSHSNIKELIDMQNTCAIPEGYALVEEAKLADIVDYIQAVSPEWVDNLGKYECCGRYSKDPRKIKHDSDCMASIANDLLQASKVIK